jgi:hypothetical protein
VDFFKGKKKTNKILLWYQHLGHASFGYVKKIFLSLFEKKLMFLVVNMMFVNYQKASNFVFNKFE